LKVEQAFLARINGADECEKIKRKVESGEKLNNEDLMRLAILPLTRKGRAANVEMIDLVIDVATKLKKDEEISASFVLSPIYVAAGNLLR